MHSDLLDDSGRSCRVPHVGGGVVLRPVLWRRLAGSARVTVVSAPAGSGKTVLLQSWISEASLTGDVAWVPVARGERDPQRFWLAVLDALRQTTAGATLVRPLTATPDLDGWAIVERLLTDLAPLANPIRLVVDDLHELDQDEQRQLELLILRAPPLLRFVLATRHDGRFGLHRLRLQGELAEIRSEDLRFTRAEAHALFQAAGVQLTGPALDLLVDKAEGWVAGLRLAALSLEGHPDPERFATEFSGTERTVAEYLLAEVLDRQTAETRKLLLRTSVLARVNGQLADLLTGNRGGERQLQDLEEANAFVVSLDAARSWFRYHQLLADLLQLELRRSEPEHVVGLHQRAAGWLDQHGYPAEAVRQAQAAEDWGLATRLLADHWPGLHLDGQDATVRALLAGFPPPILAAEPELAAVAAVGELVSGSIEAAERFMALAEPRSAQVPPARRQRAQVLLGMARLQLAWQEGNFRAVPEQAQLLLAAADSTDGAQPGLGGELRVLTLISLGDVENWTGRPDQARAHLQEAASLARKIGRPHLIFRALLHEAQIDLSGLVPRAAERSMQAIDLAERHGWTEGANIALADMTLGSSLTWQGRLDEAEPWLQRAESSYSMESNPLASMGIAYVRGQLELGRGQPGDALIAFRAAERQAARLAAPHPLTRPLRAWLVHALVGLGETGQAADILDALTGPDRHRGEMRIAAAMLRLAQDDPRSAITTLDPVLDETARVGWRSWLTEAFLLAAIAHDQLGDPVAAGRSVERALEAAEPDGVLLWFLMHPAPGLLKRHAQQQRSSHNALITQILDLLAGRGSAARPSTIRPPVEPLSSSELRVLRYLPTYLTAPEIAAELSVSTNTVKSHMRNLYAKLGVHRRADAVASARALRLLAPSGRRR
jgi:LuxR family transcriptional regulator, maltose regulon positive regulatory protein